MTNQTFEEKLDSVILAYGARAAMQNGRGSTTPAQDYRDAVQAIIKLIEEEVIGRNDYVPNEEVQDLVNHNRLVRDGLRYEQRMIIKG